VLEGLDGGDVSSSNGVTSESISLPSVAGSTKSTMAEPMVDFTLARKRWLFPGSSSAIKNFELRPLKNFEPSKGGP
jgi:hypothetical protein